MYSYTEISKKLDIKYQTVVSKLKALRNIAAIKILKECVSEWNPSSNSEFHAKSDSQLQIDKKTDIAEC